MLTGKLVAWTWQTLADGCYRATNYHWPVCRQHSLRTETEHDCSRPLHTKLSPLRRARTDEFCNSYVGRTDRRESYEQSAWCFEARSRTRGTRLQYGGRVWRRENATRCIDMIEIIRRQNFAAMMTPRLTIVLAFLCGTWNFADPFHLNVSTSGATTTYLGIRRGDPTRTTVIRHSTPLRSYVTPASGVRSTLQTVEKHHSVSSSGKMEIDVGHTLLTVN